MQTSTALSILVSPMLSYEVEDKSDYAIDVKFQDGGTDYKFSSVPQVHLGLNGFVLNMAPGVGHPDVTIFVEAVNQTGFRAKVLSRSDLGSVTTIRFSYIAIGA